MLLFRDFDNKYAVCGSDVFFGSGAKLFPVLYSSKEKISPAHRPAFCPTASPICQPVSPPQIGYITLRTFLFTSGSATVLAFNFDTRSIRGALALFTRKLFMSASGLPVDSFAFRLLASLSFGFIHVLCACVQKQNPTNC